MAQCAHEVFWHERCPHDAAEGKELCIFHLPVDQKDPAEFWKHLANYLLALYEKAGNDETKEFAAKKEAWIFAEQDDTLLEHYRGKVEPNRVWDFRGLVFPSMNDSHSFVVFVFGPANFHGAQFSGEAIFLRAQFCGVADFRYTQFSGEANFWQAQFSGVADFFRARFSRETDFFEVRFSGVAHFNGAQFNGEADFRQARFSEKASFSVAKFNGEADFSFARFNIPPSGCSRVCVGGFRQ